MDPTSRKSRRSAARAATQQAETAAAPTDPSRERGWGEIEAEAQRGMSLEGVALPPLRPVIEVEDPLLLLAQMKAFRMVADDLGVAHDPSWDETEAAVGDQLHRAAETGPGATPAP